MQNRILIIDDNPDIGNIIKSALEFDNIEILTALTPEDGLFKAKYKNPEVILLDLFLPNMNGFEVYKSLKNDVRTSKIPVIIITGHTDKATITMVKELGLSGIFYKPFQLGKLRKKIAMYLDGKLQPADKCKICGTELNELWEFCPYDGWKRKLK